MMKNFGFVALLALVQLLLPSTLFAEWERVEDARVTYLKDELFLDLAADGSFVERTHLKVKINKESAISSYGSYDVSYHGDFESMRLISASVENKGVRKKVPKKFIENRASSSSSSGFDSRKKLMVAFPDVRVGSIVEVIVERRRHKAVIRDHFEYAASVGYVHTKKGLILKVVSDKALQYHVSGPEIYVAVKEEKVGSRFGYTFSLTQDAHFKAVNESDFAKWSAEPYYPRVQLTTYPSWKFISELMHKKIEPLLTEPLPPRFVKFVEDAKKKDGFVAQANEIHTQIIKELRYMGDWRAAENFNVPKSYTEIDKSSFGDCKELSLVLAGALRALGYKAHLAMIERGTRSTTPMAIPRMNYFDHMIVRAEDREGRVYWIDPTNSAALSDVIRHDIENRPALAISDDTDKLEMTPAVRPEDSQWVFKIERTYRPDGVVRENVNFSFLKLELADALDALREAKEERTKKIWGNTIAKGDEYKMNSYQVKIADPYVAAGMEVQLEIDVKRNVVKTTAGMATMIEHVFSEYDTLNVNDMVLGVDMGEVSRKSTQLLLKGIELVGDIPEICVIESPWVAATQKFSFDKTGILVETVKEVRKTTISNAELKSEEFRALRAQIRKCQENRFLIFKYSQQ